jgi:hypothetical protein
VRIHFAKEGGLAYIPALAAPVTIDTGALEPEKANTLESMVRQAAFFELPESVGGIRPEGADYQTYTITVEDGGRTHTVRVTDMDRNPHVAELVRALNREARQVRRGPQKA